MAVVGGHLNRMLYLFTKASLIQMQSQCPLRRKSVKTIDSLLLLCSIAKIKTYGSLMVSFLSDVLFIFGGVEHRVY